MINKKRAWLSAWSLILLTSCQTGLVFPTSSVSANGKAAPVFSIVSTLDNCLLTETLRAGQTIPIGSVLITNTEENIMVTYQTTDGWELKHTHVNLSGSLEEVPQSEGGTPINGQFTTQTAHDPAVTTYTYTFPLSDYADLEQVYILTHAEAVGGE